MSRKKFTISVNHGDKSLIGYIVVLLMFFVTYMSSLSLLIMKSRMALLIMQMLAVIIYLIFKTYCKQNYISKLQFQLFISFILYQVIRGFILYQDNDLIYMVMFCVFFIFAGSDVTWQLPLLKILGFMGIVYAVATIVLIPFENVYINKIASMYTGTFTRLVGWYKEGHYAGITDHYSTNGMVLVNGLLVFTSVVFCNYKKKANKCKGILGFLILFGALIMCGKRAHLLFGIIALILGYFVYTSNEKNKYFKYFGITLVLSILLVLGYYFIPAINNVISRFFDMGQDVNILGRYKFWDAALSAFKENPIFGIGWFGFRTTVAPTIHYIGHAHNVYIQLLCETGILGISIIMIFIAIFLVYGYKVLRYIAYNKNTIKINKQILIIFAFMYQVYFLFYCTTGNPMYDVYVFPVYFASCSISTYYYNQIKKEIKRNEDRNTYLS